MRAGPRAVDVACTDIAGAMSTLDQPHVLDDAAMQAGAASVQQPSLEPFTLAVSRMQQAVNASNPGSGDVRIVGAGSSR
jgi:hypothetical protein